MSLAMSSSALSSIINTAMKLSMVIGNIGAHLHGMASRVKFTAVFCNIGALLHGVALCVKLQYWFKS